MYSYGPPCLWLAIYFEIEGNGRRFTPKPFPTSSRPSRFFSSSYPSIPPTTLVATLKFQTNTKMATSALHIYWPISTEGIRQFYSRTRKLMHRESNEKIIQVNIFFCIKKERVEKWDLKMEIR